MVWLVRHCYVEGDAVLLAWWSLAARRLNFVLNWISLLTVSIVSLTQILKQRTKENRFIAFDKERLHSAVSFENFGLSIHGHQFGHPEKFFRGEITQGEWRNFHRARALFLAGVEFHVLSCVLVCFLVKFDLLFVFSVLSRQILACASLFIYVQEHDHLCFPMLTVETAVCDWYDSICWLSSSRDRKGQSCLIRSNTVWNRWKSTLRARSTRVNLNHGTEM